MESQQSQGRRPPQISLPLRRVKFSNDRAADNVANAPVVAVVVTVHDGSSYDPLFREYRQESPEGRVSVWESSTGALAGLLDHLQSERAPTTPGGPVAELAAELAAVNADSVVFNWECCSGCSDAGFASTAIVVRAVEVLLSRGHTLMFSDFSLKALTGAWSRGEMPGSLGRCPLVKIGEFGARFELRFDPKALQSCGSAQLERVGDLCENGEASVVAMGGTIAYTLDADVLRAAPYRAELLTAATAFEGSPALEKFSGELRGARVCVIGSHRGAAGHARLRFPNGGSMLLSCGHWVELVKLDVTAERLVKVAEREYGAARSNEMAQELAQAAPARRAVLMQQYAKEIVVQSSPGSYSKPGPPAPFAPIAVPSPSPETPPKKSK